MTEMAPRGDMRPQIKDVVLPPDKAKELSEIIPKQENQFHYKIHGDWQENREVYRVLEGDKVISDYMFPDKSDMSKVQFATRKTYAKEVNMLGALVDKSVQFDKKSGTWKKLNIIQQVKHAFTKETNIPATVIDGVLHTLEQKRPVGENVREAKMDTLADVQSDLGLKYKHVEHTLTELEKSNRLLKTEVAAGAASIATLQHQVSRANATIVELNAQLRVQQAQTKDQANQTNPNYEGPIYSKPKPEDVVEGEIISDSGSLGK